MAFVMIAMTIFWKDEVDFENNLINIPHKFLYSASTTEPDVEYVEVEEVVTDVITELVAMTTKETSKEDDKEVVKQEPQPGEIRTTSLPPLLQ